jgi:hypothetical protein
LLELKLATSSDCYLRGSLANITGRASTFIDRPVKRKQCGSCARSLSCHAPEAVAHALSVCWWAISSENKTKYDDDDNRPA